MVVVSKEGVGWCGVGLIISFERSQERVLPKPNKCEQGGKWGKEGFW